MLQSYKQPKNSKSKEETKKIFNSFFECNKITEFD